MHASQMRREQLDKSRRKPNDVTLFSNKWLASNCTEVGAVTRVVGHFLYNTHA